ncbi:spike base protein, RCAP_Rcc01079 family [Devosia sp.]|uniref:spike base protein, RCAP_Rcc01079 family n=1 Tax=Devosia sp. TaxID=1871048 RepID=UPI00086F4092|nr:hypothetical protein [Devosia sp.]ODT76277.1 MAG: hypothetical protein ABS76_31810 [Pelagibacterium sp. SCN 64-44]
MTDRYADYVSGLESPAQHGFAATPSNSADLPEVTRALYVGGAGAVAVILASGAELSFAGVASGTILPLRVRRLKASGTTASNVVGLV